MSILQAKKPKVKHPTEDLPFGFNFTPWLKTGETVASVIDVTATNGLSVDNAAVNASAETDDDGETCDVGYGVTYDCADGSAGQDYLVTIRINTSLSRKLTAIQKVEVRDR